MFEPILLTNQPGSSRQDLDAYRSEGGYKALETARAAEDPETIIAAIEAAHLRGRGGASFPTARKWRIAAQANAEQKHVIANGGEHEPGSNKDKYLVEHYPHKVLEGLLLAGLATGAKHGWLYLIEDMTGPLRSAKTAIADLTAAGLLGDFEIRIHRAPTTYVAGEETAAIDSIEGGPGKPRPKPPYPGEAGVFGFPTTVNNVETLAHVPAIVRNGAEWFASIGTEASKGTMLFTLPDSVERPGVYELPFGATYRQLIEHCGGGTVGGRAIRGLLPALSCAFLSPEQLDTPICYDALAAIGTSPGCGGVHLVLEGDDPGQKLAEIAEFFQSEQCGQCPPCRMITGQLAHVLEAVRGGATGDFVGQFEKIAAFGRGKGDCSLIQMATTPIRSGAKLFASDLAGD